MLNPYYIYRHIRPDTNQVFYVGKGKNRRNSYDYERSKTTMSRNKIWQQIVAKNNGQYNIEIVMEFDCPNLCVAKEKELIALYGRKNVTTGTLANLTDGGEGTWGLIVSEKERERRRQISGDKHPNWGKKLSAETCRKKSEALKGEKHHLFGKRLPKQWVENLAKGKMGEKNPFFGKPTPVSKKVQNVKTGAIYDSIARAAEAEGMKAGRLYSIFDGHTKKNRTDLILI